MIEWFSNQLFETQAFMVCTCLGLAALAFVVALCFFDRKGKA